MRAKASADPNHNLTDMFSLLQMEERFRRLFEIEYPVNHWLQPVQSNRSIHLLELLTMPTRIVWILRPR